MGIMAMIPSSFRKSGGGLLFRGLQMELAVSYAKRFAVAVVLLCTLPLAVFLHGSPVAAQANSGQPGCGEPPPQLWVTKVSSAEAPGAVVLSGLLADDADLPVDALLYVTDSSGMTVGGSPTATGTVPSGTRFTYDLPADILTAGATYTWYIRASAGIGCMAYLNSSTNTFIAPAASPSPPTTITTTVSGSSLTARAGNSSSSACGGAPCAMSAGAVKVGFDGTATGVSTLKPTLTTIPSVRRLPALCCPCP